MPGNSTVQKYLDSDPRWVPTTYSITQSLPHPFPYPVVYSTVIPLSIQCRPVSYPGGVFSRVLRFYHAKAMPLPRSLCLGDHHVGRYGYGTVGHAVGVLKVFWARGREAALGSSVC